MRPTHRMNILADQWSRLAGAQIAREAIPLAVIGSSSGNQLVLRALSWGWKRELAALSKYLVERINKAAIPEMPELAGVVVLAPTLTLVSARPPKGGKSA